MQALGNYNGKQVAFPFAGYAAERASNLIDNTGGVHSGHVGRRIDLLLLGT